MAKNHFYNLPNAWNPGYADPEYVIKDGLERRASVTPMTPRGTYDDPKVGSGGYALPNYIGKEGYGQGAYVTKWAKRGTFDVAAIPQVGAPVPTGDTYMTKPRRTRSMIGMGDIAYSSSNIFGQFGTKAATRIVARVMKMPASQRRAALKAALDKIDPMLFSRAERYTNELITKGTHPRAALVAGLAKAMSEGMLEELDRAGRSGTAPRANTLPGLGCYGATSALGALPTTMTTKGGTVKGGTITAGPAAPTCPPPSGYTWDFTAGTPFLRRLKVNEQPVNGPCGATVTSGGTSGQGTVTTSETPRAGKILELGPSESRIWFRIPEQTGRFTMVQPGAASSTGGVAVGDAMMTSEIWNDIVTQMQKASAEYRKLRAVTDKVGKDLKGDGYGLPAVSGNYLETVLNGTFPLYYFTYPGTSTTFGLHVRYVSPGVWEFTTRQKPPSSNPFSQIFGALKKLFAKIVDVVGDVVDEVADMACELVNHPNAAAAAGQASGPGAAIGVGAAQAACGGGSVPTAPPTILPGGDTGTLVLLGAGALLVAAIVKKKRKKKG
jgi:hypothetical protein